MPLEHAILAILDFEPMSGYDLKKFFDQSVAHFWSATQSHIYKALDGLDKQAWVRAELVVQQGKPNRKVYHLTAAGSAELRRWLTTPLPLDPVREAWLIQIFFSHSSSNAEIAALLEARMQAIRASLEGYRRAVQDTIEQAVQQSGMQRAGELWQITLDYGIAYYEAELAWHAKTLERARNLPPLPDPPEN